MLNSRPITAPVWLRETPIVGTQLDAYWQGLAGGREEAVALLQRLLEPAKDFLLFAGKTIGQSLLQMTFSVFIDIFIGPPILALGLTLVRPWKAAAPPAETRGHPGNGATPVGLRPCRGGVSLILLAIFRNGAGNARFPSAVVAPYASEQTPAGRENILSSTRR